MIAHQVRSERENANFQKNATLKRRADAAPGLRPEGMAAGPARAGAINASVTSVAQDVFNGRPISTERAGESAILGNLLGGLAGVWGRAASNGLSSKAKGRLGEALGDMRSTINGERRVWAPKTRDPLSTTNKKDYWYPDGRSGQKRLEDKFGVGAELSPRQIRAQAVLGPKFQINSFLPSDIGKIAAAPAAAAASPILGGQRRRRRQFCPDGR